MLDESPTGLVLSHGEIEQYQPPGTEVGVFTVIDPWESPQYAFSLVSGEGDADNGLFTIDGDALRTAADFSSSAGSEFSIRVRATVLSGFWVEEIFTLTVKPNEAPTEIALTGNTVSEKQPPGIVIGTLAALDADRFDSHTFEFAAGEGDAGNEFFEIEGDLLRAAASFDHSQAASHTIRVRATDAGGLSVTQILSVTVLPNQPGDLDRFFRDGGSIDGPVRAVLQLVDGRILIGGEFTMIDGEPRGGIARLLADGSLDPAFAAGSGTDGAVHALAIQRDGKVVIAGDFTTVGGQPRNGVARLTEAGDLDASFTDPEVIGGAVYAVAVQRTGRVIIGGDFTSAAGGAAQNLARLNVDGTLDTSFGGGVEGANGAVRAIAIDWNGEFLVGGNFTSIHGRERRSLARFREDGALLPAGLTHPFIGAMEDLRILFDGKVLSSGGSSEPTLGKVIRLHPDGSLDLGFAGDLYGPGTVHSLSAQNDGTVLVGGSFTSLSGISRNRIARLTASGNVDPDFGNGLEGADGEVFAVAARPDGKILVAGAFSEINGFSQERLALLHGDGPVINQAPVDVRLTGEGVREGQPAGTRVGFLAAFDPDPWDAHTFALVPGQGHGDNGLFTIVGDELRTAVSFDFSEAESRSIRVRATDAAGLSVEKILTVNVLPDPSIQDVSLSNNTVVDGRPAGAVVGTLAGVGRDPSETYTFALAAGEGDDDNALFVIDGDNLATAVSLSRADSIVRFVRIRATNTHGYSLERTFTIFVEPHRPPSDILLSQNTISENAPPGTAVAILRAVDPVPENTHTFALVPGDGDAGNDVFAIEDNLMRTATELDFSFQSSHSIRIRATNEENLWIEKVFEIILEPNQPPTAVFLSGHRIGEGRPVGATVGMLSATDPDSNDVHSFALVSGAGDGGNAFYSISGHFLKTAAVFNTAIQSEYSVRIHASDSRGFSVEDVFIIRVTPAPLESQGPGNLDHSFDTAAVGITDDVNATAVQSDGKILVGGS